MEHAIHAFVDWTAGVHGAFLFLLIAVLLGILGRAADVLVDEAVVLAKQAQIPTVVIGATIVSLGTTTPEAAVSVLAALNGDPGLALGNAVGSVICDTGLILGLAIVLSSKPLPLDRRVVNRQGWIQLGSGLMLIAATFPFERRLPRPMGFFFLGLLALYLYKSIEWSRREAKKSVEAVHVKPWEKGPVWAVALKLVGAVAVVVASSHVLIPAVQKAAVMLGVPEDVIAATLVAFGTSLPELVTAMTAVRKGHGELAVGNVIGADILNVLFVAGAACAATAGGLSVPPTFYKLHFPVLAGVLIVFRAGIHWSGDRMRRPFGFLLLGLYAAYLLLQYAVLGGVGA